MRDRRNQIYIDKSENKSGIPKNVDTLTVLRVMDVAKWISEGKSAKSVLDRIQKEYDIKYHQATKYYDAALRYLAPTEEETRRYKENMWKIQIDRLEKIMDKGIDTQDPQMLRLAKDCIAEINKLLGMTQGESVTIENKKDNEQTIKIEFSK